MVFAWNESDAPDIEDQHLLQFVAKKKLQQEQLQQQQTTKLQQHQQQILLQQHDQQQKQLIQPQELPWISLPPLMLPLQD